MFAFSVHVTSAGNVLTVDSPINIIVMGILGLFLFPFLLLLGTVTRTWWGRLGLIAIAVVAVVFAIDPAKLVLDANKGVATVDSIVLLMPVHRTFPLASIQSAEVYSLRSSKNIVLRFNDGGSYDLTMVNGLAGNNDAVWAINQFIASHQH